jgi:hypothetical protein
LPTANKVPVLVEMKEPLDVVRMQRQLQETESVDERVNKIKELMDG